MKKNIIGLAFLTVLSSQANAAIKGTAEFIAKANPGFLEIEGKGGKVDGSKASVDKNNMISGVFSLAVADFTTGIDQRDHHLREYLEATKYPSIEFQLDPISAAGGTKKAFSGKLTLHGVTKPVSGLVDLTVTKANAKFSIDVTQFGIKIPTYKLLTVGKDVDISVTIDLQ